MREQPSSKDLESKDFESRKLELVKNLDLYHQWENQVETLRNAGILEELTDPDDIGILGIDGKGYPVPRYEDILERITIENIELLKKKREAGFNQLLLVPFAKPLDSLIFLYKQALLQKHKEGKLFSTDGKQLDLNVNEPIRVLEEYKEADIDESLIYYPQEFSDNHQGQTKQQLIDLGNAWEILLIEDLPDLPGKGEGLILNQKRNLKTTRIPLEAGKSPNEYLNILKTDPNYQGEQGFTPEAWFSYALTSLLNRNLQIDDYQGQGKASYLTSSCFPTTSVIPSVFWNRIDQRVRLARASPDLHNSVYGSRVSVKI
jgi:hypothetical protein